MWPDLHQIYRTNTGVIIYVSQGSKSPHDFVVRYREPGKRQRTPKHIHFIIDLYLKRKGNRELTQRLVEHFVNQVIGQVQPSLSSPPSLQVFSPIHTSHFQPLNAHGEYSVEFILVATELIMIQEKTNYPHGNMNLKLFQRFLSEADIFILNSEYSFI